MTTLFIQTALIKAYLFIILLFFSISLAAATVEFPSTVQPGEASLVAEDNRWVFSNNVLSASFLVQDGKLYFGGSPQLSLASGTELFEIVLGNGTKVKASEMTMQSLSSQVSGQSPIAFSDVTSSTIASQDVSAAIPSMFSKVKVKDLTGDSSAVRFSGKLNGKALVATFTYNTLTVNWRAVLRDGSHYLRTELELSTTAATAMTSIQPMIYKVLNRDHDAPEVVGNTRGALVASDRLFAGVENPIAHNLVSGMHNPNFHPASWKPESWVSVLDAIPAGIINMGFKESEIVASQGQVTISAAGSWSLLFQYVSGTHRLNIAGVDILKDGVVVASDYHIGYTGHAAAHNTYRLNVPEPGEYTLRYFGEIRTETITSTGNVSVTPPVVGATIALIPSAGPDPETLLTGRWSRNTTLQTTDTFRVSSVVGLVAEGQQRRSYLAYHERERAVPWRSFIHYNSWYELNINRNNDPNPLNRMTETQCLPVVSAWKTKLYDRYGVGIDAFVWDDGWDDFNSLWDFHAGFPNGFHAMDDLSAKQGAGTGVWLGPVGGYGSSKSQRIAYWNNNYSPSVSNFQLSNKVYFDAFVGRCAQMVDDYDLRYFKFDGISTHFSATGPGNEEDAEGILNVIHALRQKRPDLFINTTVGTWASPFWFYHADAIWRQENDFDQVGNQGDARERWITYRDRLVYQNFVTNSPLCPINSLMTHGLIVTKHGPPSVMPRTNTASTLKGIIREMRCAFASGSGMVELYVDNDLMSSIGNGVLWKELADCINWHRENSDVLADIHWVGGNPWDGTKANVYGWAAWSPQKSTLTLRNPSASTQVFTTTLRAALDIPGHVTGSIRLTNAFGGQHSYAGITDESVDVDATLTFTMPPFDVVVLNGEPSDATSIHTPNAGSGKYGDAAVPGLVVGMASELHFSEINPGTPIRIFDTQGLLLHKFSASDSSFALPIPQPGVYLVELGGRVFSVLVF
jgi:hypothetical protein